MGSSMSPDERAIRELVASWMEASQAGDTARVLSLMADDAVFMVAGQEPFGKQAFARAAAAQQKFRMEGASDIREIEVSGDLAYMRSYLTVTMIPLGGGKPMRRTGWTLTILRKQTDGRWLLARDANLMSEQS